MNIDKIESYSKGKTKVDDYNALQQQIVKDSLSGDSGVSVSVEGSVDSNDHMKVGLNNANSSNSDISYRDNDDVTFDGGDDYADEDDVDEEDCEDDDDFEYLYEEEDDYLAIQSQFDNVDLPSGVEASIDWLKESATSTSGTSILTAADSSDGKRKSTILDVVETKRKATENNGQAAATSCSSAAIAESSSNSEPVDNKENEIIRKFKNFKQFDTVEDVSDHHFSKMDLSDKQSPNPKGWAKRIQEEWKILEKDLPDTISVRVYESRMDLLRAVIVGPAGTPYHDGLFVFDCLFPSTYPNTSPTVYYYSGGLRLNPNLYECGKVCLSLLGTWSGQQNEMWIPGTSTMLQVLVSIQALILNAKPFFNEPGHESSFQGKTGDRRSREYSENAFILSLKTMMYTIRRPPKYFEDYVIGHFHIRAHDILVACKAYLDGATVGTVTVRDGVAIINEAERTASEDFKVTLKKIINSIITNFTRFGEIDCEKFRIVD